MSGCQLSTPMAKYGSKVPNLDIKYNSENELGIGRFGIVYKGVCTKTGKAVAVKKISTPGLKYVAVV